MNQQILQMYYFNYFFYWVYLFWTVKYWDMNIFWFEGIGKHINNVHPGANVQDSYIPLKVNQDNVIFLSR